MNLFQKLNCFRKRTNDAADGHHPPRLALLLFAILQNGMAGGVIFGWAAIDSTLLVASESNGGAAVAPEKTAHVFSWASSVAMVSAFCLGAILDFSGPRVCSILSCLSIAIGSRMLASSQDFAQFAFGACVVSFGGPGIGASIIHLSNLFPNNRNLVMSLLSGSIAMSFSVFTIFDYLWQHFEFATFHSLFKFYSWFVFMLAMGAFLLYPDEPYEEMKSDDSITGSEEKMYDDDDDEEQENETELLVKSSLASPTTVILKNVASLSVIHEHHHHHESHIQSVAAGPSLIIQQPLHSYLRANARSESFMISKEAMDHDDDPEMEMMISLKDQPFFKQLFSWTYFRSSVFFWICTFVTNFYVSSISTELADVDQYSTAVQHQLTQTYTLFMSCGVLASIFSGFLIDAFGVEIVTSLVLIFGQLQMVTVLFFGQYQAMMVASFGFYTLFRSFLYPVFIASLTSRLGFKYFGILLGIGFAISGLWQLLMAPLNDAVAGDCHLEASPDPSGDDGCFDGYWISLHLLQLSVLLGLMIVPFMDYRAKVARESAIQAYHAREWHHDSGLGLPIDYGSMSSM